MAGETQQKHNAVSLKEYEDAKPWHVLKDEIDETLTASQQDDEYPQFILRLLDETKEQAFDRMMVVTRLEELGALNAQVWLCEIQTEARYGMPEPFTLDEAGFVTNPLGDEPQEERGYLLGAEGIDPAELMAESFALVLRRAAEQTDAVASEMTFRD